MTADELSALGTSNPAYEQIRAEHKRQEEARQAAKAAAEKIDGILDRYEHELKDYYTNHPAGDIDMQAVILRLKSRNPGAVRAVLKHSAHLVGKTEFRKALSSFLNRPEIDDTCAEIIAALPFDAMTRKLLASDSAANAKNMPAGLILSLIGNDAGVIESFLLNANPEDCSAILRRWPAGRIMNANVVRRLLESNDARVLVPVLSLMKSGFPGQASQHKKRLGELEMHMTAAVRALAKKLV